MLITKKIINIVIISLIISCLPWSFAFAERKQKVTFVPGEIIIKIQIPHPSTITAQSKLVLDKVQGTIRKFGLQSMRLLFQQETFSSNSHQQLSHIYLARFPWYANISQIIQKLKSLQFVKYAEPNYLYKVSVLPDDPQFSSQWALHNEITDFDIDAPEGWDIEQGSPEVIIAVIDTGADYTHPDLAANIWHNPLEIPGNGIDDDGNGYIDDVIGWDFVDAAGGASDEDFEMPDNDPMDKHGHGTHVAGIAGAVSNNGLGIAGVAWNCKIMPVRAGYKTATGDGVLESDDAARAIVYAAENGAKIINLSWGDTQQSSIIEDAIDFAVSNGALVCAAAGNENSNAPMYPASSANNGVIAVGATDNQDQRAYFSNYGSWVDVSAPGVSIYSTYLNNGLRNMSGTSMATPIVSGVAALLFSHFYDQSTIEVKNRIMRSADVINALAGANIISGRINLYSALTQEYNTPHIFSISPDEAHAGDVITIYGDQFGSEQAESLANFAPGKQGEVLTWNDSSITCRVPEGAETGSVSVTTAEGVSNAVPLTVLITYYSETILETNEFIGAGTVQGWQADDQSWLYQLPFSFPFFGTDYTQVYVSSNGFLDFTNGASSYNNSTNELKARVMIAPFWCDLRTNGSAQIGEDIYVHTPSSDSVCIRWVAEDYETAQAVNIEVVLYQAGRIQFNYGAGNSSLFPTIGISGGGGDNYQLSTFNGSTALNLCQSVLFSPQIQLHTFTIELDLGWNLISLPLKPLKNKIADILGTAGDGIKSVWGYEGGAWNSYFQDNASPSDLFTMDPGHGYWVETSQAGLTIKLQGQLTIEPVHLKEGWNFVGFNTLTSLSVDEALNLIDGSYNNITIWSYEEEAWKSYHMDSAYLNDLTEIKAGKGYWVNRS